MVTIIKWGAIKIKPAKKGNFPSVHPVFTATDNEKSILELLVQSEDIYEFLPFELRKTRKKRKKKSNNNL